MNSVPKRLPVCKPFPSFPLSVHPTGYWVKRIRRKLYYFGPTTGDEDGIVAKARFDAEAAYIYKHGRRPPKEIEPSEPTPTPDTFCVKNAVDSFLDWKDTLVEGGRLSRRHFADLKRTGVIVADTLGRATPVSSLKPDHFAKLYKVFADRFGLVALKNSIVRTRSIFKFAYGNDHIDKPVKFGDVFAIPSAGEIEHERNEKPERLFTATEIRQLLDAASQPMKAMILLGINCGLGNTDCSAMQFRHLDIDTGWLNFPRPKTGRPRRCKLWCETIAALNEAIASRPTPKSEADADSKCDEKITVRPASRASRTRASTSRRMAGSRFVVGSSRISSGVSVASVPAKASFRFVPVESCDTRGDKSSSRRFASCTDRS